LDAAEPVDGEEGGGVEEGAVNYSRMTKAALVEAIDEQRCRWRELKTRLLEWHRPPLRGDEYDGQESAVNMVLRWIQEIEESPCPKD
jgi:hypothetical protein